jgi:DNA-binding NarL/FixJ family response regulator
MVDLEESGFLNALLQGVEQARQLLLMLSPRESEILGLVYVGRTNKAISISTSISEKTVEKHRARIMQKLSLASTAELIQLVTRARLIDDLKQMHQLTTSTPHLTPGLYTSGRLRDSA